MNFRKILLYTFYFFITIIIISSTSLYNGYPLIYYDSVNYLEQSINLNDVSTNPPGYPIFIRIFSWQDTLWPVVFAQSLLVSILIFLVLKNLIGDKYLFQFHFFTISFLTIFSSLGWTASLVMADIFAAMAILSVYLALNSKSSLPVKIFCWIILFISCISHFSIILLIVVIISIFFIYDLKSSGFQLFRSFKKVVITLIVIVISVLFINNYHLIVKQNQKSQDIKHVIIMARLMETGILDEFLDKNCDNYRYTLCYYKDSFPNRPSQFVWNKESPFFKTGGWGYSEEEYNEIITRIFSNPKYFSLFIYKGIVSSMRQLSSFQVEVIHFSNDFEGPKDIFKKHFKHEAKKFAVSLQHYKSKHDLQLFNIVFYTLVLFSIVTTIL